MERATAPKRAGSDHKRANLLTGCAVAALALPLPAMAQNTVELREVVVTAGGFEQLLKDAPASVSIVSGEDLQKGAFKDLTSALAEVQGVAVTGGSNEQDIYIRGLSGAYTLILIDGRRVSTREARTNGNAGYEQSNIPPVSAIERIEVVRGPMSSLYGSDAMGGVINIITKKADQVWSGSVTVEGTKQQHSDIGDSRALSFNISGPLVQDRLSLQVWGRYYKRDQDTRLVASADGRSSAAIQGAEDRNIGARLVFTPTTDHEFSLEAGRTLLEATTSNNPSSLWGSPIHRRDHNRDYIALGYRGHWGAATTELNLQREWAERIVYDAAGTIPTDRIPRVRNTVLDGKLTLPWQLAGTHTLVTGFQLNNGLVTDKGNANYQSLSVNTWAVFAENEWRVSDAFAITGGVRYDRHSIYGGNVTPRLYGVWSATDTLTIKGGISTGFRAPDIRSIAPGYYLSTQQGAGFIAPNPNLKPEKSTSYELAALWDNNNGLSFGATAFYTDFRQKLQNRSTGMLVNPATGDIIDPLGGAACNAAALGPHPGYYCLWQNFNVDSATVKGLELTGSWQINDALRVRGNYTLTDSKQKTGAFAGFPLERTPRHTASLRFDWQTPVQNLDTWLSATYHGSEIASGARIGTNGAPITIGGVDGRKYSGYTTFDIGGSYRVNDAVVINAAIYNVLDKKTNFAESNVLNEGRRLWLGVTTQF